MATMTFQNKKVVTDTDFTVFELNYFKPRISVLLQVMLKASMHETRQEAAALNLHFYEPPLLGILRNRTKILLTQ